MYVRNSIMQMATQLMDSEKHCLSTPCLVCLFFIDRHSVSAEPECSTLLVHPVTCLEELALLSVAVWNALSRGKKSHFVYFALQA